VLHWPIRVIRIVTDPVVDTIFLVISYLVLPSIVRLFDGFFTATVWGLSAIVPRDALEKSVRFVHATVSVPLPLLHSFAERAVER
jgi:E3 ubiquitin-protein ligase MARCH6